MTTKMDLVGELRGHEALKAYHQEIATIYAIARGRIEIANAIRLNKERLEEIRACMIASGTIEGKNETERNAKLVVALSEDASYIRRQADLVEYERQAAMYDADLGKARDTASALKLEIRLGIATLSFLAGEELS